MNETSLRRLLKRAPWVVFGAAVGLAVGGAIDRSIGSVYSSTAEITFSSTALRQNQAREVSEAVAVVFRQPGFTDALERDAGVTIRSLSVAPTDRQTVTVAVQADGAGAAVAHAAASAARRACETLSSAAADPLATEIEREIAARVPAPVRKTVRPWFDVALEPSPPSAPAELRRRPALGGLLIGLGLAVFSVFIDAVRQGSLTPKATSERGAAAR